MMEYIEFILLGLLQGITEFFPVSSSGHLLIGMKLFDIKEHGIIIEIFLHLGTLLSIIAFWYKDIKYEFNDFILGNRTYFYSIIIGTLPAAIIGLIFKTYIDETFFNIDSLSYLSFNYLVLAVIIFSSKFFMNGLSNKITYKYALLIGLVQAFAIMPGLSRSGLTIVMGLLVGLNFKTSLKFSFMLAIPILTFASFSLIFSYNIFDSMNVNFLLFCGIISSFLSGYFVLILLQKILMNNKFWYFSFYCLILSLGLFYG